MILTSPDISSLAESLSRWEIAEYVFAALVAVGCIGEYIADFTKWFRGKENEERKDRLAKCSTLLLITALSLELICLVRTNMLSGELIGSLNDEANEADGRAKTALSNSGVAITQSGAAKDSSEKADTQSDKAVTSASNALILARDARREADSFEKDIVSAKTQATEAESHLAESLKRTAEVTEELNRLKSPRSLNNIPQLVSTLEPYKDTEYTFSAVCQEEECINLLKAIDAMLQSAGWKRVKPPGGFPAINIYGSAVDFSVTVSLTSGIKISVDSSDPSTIISLPIEKLPQPVRAAIALNFVIFPNLSPPEEIGEHKVNVDKGTSTVVRISVGKKP